MVVRLLSSAILVVCTAFKNACWKSDKKEVRKKEPISSCGLWDCMASWKQLKDKLNITNSSSFYFFPFVRWIFVMFSCKLRTLKQAFFLIDSKMTPFYRHLTAALGNDLYNKYMK